MSRKRNQRRIGCGFQKFNQRLLMAGGLDIETDESYDQVSVHGGSQADKLGASGNNFAAHLHDYSF